MAESNKMKDMSVNKLMIQMGIPMILSMALQAVYNIVDSAFVGNMRVGSEAALNALTLVFPVQMLMVAVGIGTGVGTNALLARTLGQGNSKKAAKVAGNSLFLGVIIYVVCLLFGIFGVKAYISSQTVDAEVLEMGVSYLRICCVVSFGIVFFSLFEKLLQATGRSLYSTIGQVVGAVVNIILDPIFIFWLDMGIQGAAIATVISMAAGAAFVMSHFISKDSIVRFHTKYFRLKGSIIWNIFTIGMSPFSMQLAGSVVVVIMNHALKENGGDLAIGASGIISSIAMLLVMLIIGIAQGMQPIVGFNHGAGHHDRVLATLRLSIIVSTLITGVGCIVSLLFPRLIVSVFSTDAELVSITDNGLRLTMLVFFVVGSQITISQFFQSIGVAWKAMFLSLSRQVLFLIPAILLFPPIWGLDGVWLAQPFSDFIAAVTAWGFLWYHVKNVKNKG